LGKASSVYAVYEDLVNLLREPLQDGLYIVNCHSLIAYRSDFAQAIYRDILEARSQSLTRDALLALGLRSEWQSLISIVVHRIVRDKIFSGGVFSLSSTRSNILDNNNNPDDSFGEHSYDFEEQAIPELRGWLENHILPILRIWDVNHLNVLSKQISYKLLLVLGQLRARQLFDIISDFPQSSPALQDLIECSEQVDIKDYVSSTLADALQARLLHPGASTRDIIQFYTHLIRSLRFVDPSGVILSHVIGPVRSYLRARNDTIPVIVASLLGQTGDFTLLHNMMRESSDLNSGLGRSGRGAAGDQSITMYEDVTASGLNGITEGTDADSLNVDITAMDETKRMVFIPEPDEDWAPRPIDAGPDYRQSKKSDVIAIIISIFDDEQGFIAAIEKSCAEQIIQIRKYDSRKEYELNENLKKRFWDSSMNKCDVMLNDIKRSQRIDRRVHRVDAEVDQALEDDVKIAMSILHPLILSRQFWPLFNDDGTIPAQGGGVNPGNSVNGSGGAGASGDSMMFASAPLAVSGAANPGALNTSAPVNGANASEQEQLPKSYKEAMESYQNQFSKLVHGRKLRWLPGRNFVHVHIEMDNGQTLDDNVTPLQASIIQMAAANKSSLSTDIVLTETAEKLGVSVQAAQQAFTYWTSRRILDEISPGRYVVVDEAQ
jgi:anaphase-promoting complex subunit 2